MINSVPEEPGTSGIVAGRSEGKSGNIEAVGAGVEVEIDNTEAGC